MATNAPPMLARILLALTGLGLLILSLNAALGGIVTLGWQFPDPGLTAADPAALARHDSNARFFGGLLAGQSLLIAAAAFWPGLQRTAALVLLTMATGGLARLAGPDALAVMTPVLLPSLALELIGAPLFALWLWRTVPEGRP